MLVDVFCNSNKNFPTDFYDCLPRQCPECGMPMEISETLTGLHCSNLRCPDKVAQRLVAIANKLGVKNLGEARAMAFIRDKGMDNPLTIFMYNPDEDGTLANNISMDVSREIYKAFQERKSFTLAEYVRIANLPFVQESAVAIFSGYDNLTKAYADIESKGVEFIRDKLNIKASEDVSVRALRVYDSLMAFKVDLFQAIDSVDIIKTQNLKTIQAVCSTAVGEPFKSKANFYAFCNNNYSGIHINFGSSVTKKTDYLVWSKVGGKTNKVKKAEAYGVPILTAKEFMMEMQTLSRKE